VLNKLDMVPAEEREARVKDFIKRFKYKGPVFEISALTREGCETLMLSVFEHVAKVAKSEQPHVAVDPRFDVAKDGSLKARKDKLPEDLASDPRFSN
jgi:GTP-binding protein